MEPTTSIDKNEDDPPDSSQLSKQKVSLKEPPGATGSFFVAPAENELPRPKGRISLRPSPTVVPLSGTKVGQVPCLPADRFCDFIPAASLRLRGRSDSRRRQDILSQNNIEIISDIDRCFGLWQELSSKKTLFDTWEFRFAFYKGYRFKPHFLLLKNNEDNLALLPLWYDEDKKKYTWFGSDWQEEVRFFAKNPDSMERLLSVSPSPLFLNAIAEESYALLNNKEKFQIDDAKYILELEGLKTHEDHLMSLKKNTRHNLRKDRRRIERQNPEIIINDFSLLPSLIALNKKRFKKDSGWNDSRRVETFSQVIKLSGKSYTARMVAIKIGDRIAGADLICVYNGTYFALSGGYDVKDFSGIGNYMNLVEIDDAISLGCNKIDFLQNNFEWKDNWLAAVPLFKYEKN